VLGPTVSPELTRSTLALALWWWAGNVFAPALAMRKAGLYTPSTLGNLPVVRRPRGGGPRLSRRLRKPRLLRQRPEIYDSVEAFDECAPGYEEAVRPFSQPIFQETIALLRPHLSDRPRILDPSAGPGGMAIELAKLYPRGEVVAADLSRGMVEAAHQRARTSGAGNMAFFQADVANPPKEFLGYFDAIFCCLSFHHYPDEVAAANTFRRVLRKGGIACVADPGPAWFIAISKQLSKLTDPGFIRHRTGDEFMELFSKAGFRSVSWTEVLPGIGVTLAAA